MKTPKQLLWERHPWARFQLEAQREQILEQMERARTDESTAVRTHSRLQLSLRDIAGITWRELVWVRRATWSGLAVIWVGLILIRFGNGWESPPVSPARETEWIRLVQSCQKQNDRRTGETPVGIIDPRPREPRPHSRGKDLAPKAASA
jgi:hypothetical protein